MHLIMILSSEKFQKLLMIKRPDVVLCSVYSGIAGLTHEEITSLKGFCASEMHTQVICLTF